MGKDKSEEILFQEFLDGNNRRLSYFFNKYYRGLCVYAYKITESQSVSEDIVQSLFVNLWEKKKNITIQTSVKSYFLRSVHNRCLDFIAHNSIKENHRLYQLDHFTEEEAIDYPLMDFELKERLKNAIDSLPDVIRESFVMNRIEGLTYKQIAEKEGVTVKAIEYRISKSLTILRELLKDYLPIVLLFFFKF